MWHSSRLSLVDTDPGSETITGFPMALIPTFLVPLGIELHAISLRQLRRGAWTYQGAADPADAQSTPAP
jgi:hypothetical protein